MSSQKKQEVINIENLFDIPYKNVGKIRFERSGQVMSLNIQSLNEFEQEELRNMFPQPDAPLKKKKKLDENGNPIMITKAGPMAGKHMLEEVRDYEDAEFIKAHSRYITDVAAGAAALGIQTKWALKDSDEKEDSITLVQKIERLKKLFNYDSINYIGQEVLKLSTVSNVDLEEAIKN